MICRSEMASHEVGLSAQSVDLTPPPCRIAWIGQHYDFLENSLLRRIREKSLVSLVAEAEGSQGETMLTGKGLAQVEQARRARHVRCGRDVPGEDKNVHQERSRLSPADALVSGRGDDLPGDARKINNRLLRPQGCENCGELWRLIANDEHIGLRRELLDARYEQR
jgi:hypothetical protein